MNDIDIIIDVINCKVHSTNKCHKALDRIEEKLEKLLCYKTMTFGLWATDRPDLISKK
jgi:hypothetical protein